MMEKLAIGRAYRGKTGRGVGRLINQTLLEVAAIIYGRVKRVKSNKREEIKMCNCCWIVYKVQKDACFEISAVHVMLPFPTTSVRYY